MQPNKSKTLRQVLSIAKKEKDINLIIDTYDLLYNISQSLTTKQRGMLLDKLPRTQRTYIYEHLQRNSTLGLTYSQAYDLRAYIEGRNKGRMYLL